ncbi:hypothetical protein LOK49_LG03G03334 [Camellia lanceoleosa]|uniref:Uncharacterized protein n=1 Tax=Camellia lanceoleosa TaxID=1840588 RepID=A0ACC0I6W8_9ERIC|nr:hypothetical protein LOK49_LG03G03334 [Camellia lanceoleosa]
MLMHFWCEAEVSQCLLEASHCNDLKSTLDCISDRFVDVCCNELANEVHVEYEEFKTDVTVFFLALHAGTVTFVRKLLVKSFVSLGGPYANTKCGEGIGQCRKGVISWRFICNLMDSSTSRGWHIMIIPILLRKNRTFGADITSHGNFKSLWRRVLAEVYSADVQAHLAPTGYLKLPNVVWITGASDGIGKTPTPGQAVYSASKFALIGYFHTLRSEV